jgi:diguanylate cyclase (GGDEF)-like protein
VHLIEHDEAIAEALAAEEITCDPNAAADVRVVLGDGGFEERVRAIRSGADIVVARPADVEALVRRVMALRERREQPARRILAVEDDPTTGALMRGFLGAAGYEVAICREAGEFEATLLSFAPDLVLMDVQLTSDVSGHDLVRYVRQSERFAMLPVIIVTSDSQRRAILDSAHAGADLLIAKPVDWDVLLSQIAQCLERAAAVRERTDRDALTGVLTRSAFESRARQRAASGSATVLVLLDLDHFKDVNDTHGHAAGDRVLASTGALLRRNLGQADVVARYGGEEFALLLEDVSVPAAVSMCERLLADLSTAAGVTFSAGIAPLEGSFDEACRRADAALYEAKRSGRARVVV